MLQEMSWFGYGYAFIIGGISLLVYLLMSRKRQSNYPPGPTALPIIGNLLQIKRAKDLPTFLCDMRKVYGDCFRLYFGKIPVVIIFGYENINKILIDDNRCNDRLSWEEKGILYANGEKWAQLQNLVISVQHKERFQENIQRTIESELEEARDVLTRHIVVDPSELCQKLAVSVISTLVFGERFDSSRPELQTLKPNLDCLVQHARSSRALTFLPFLAYLPSTKSKKANAIEANEAVFTFLKLKLEQHRDNIDQSSPRDVMDMYIKNEKSELVDDEEFYQTCLDLFIAGIDGMTSSLLSVIIFLVKYPLVQDRCRQEISELVPDGRSLTLKDVHNLKFVTSTIKEVLRISRTVATSVFRSTGDNPLNVGPYTIPPNHVVLFEFRDPHVDPNLWTESEAFNPERWMTANENKLGYMPFGTGKRPCVGKDLAMISLHLIVLNLLMRYILCAEEGEDISFDQVYTGTSLRPKPYKIELKKI